MVLLEISCSWQDSVISEPAGGATLAHKLYTICLLYGYPSHPIGRQNEKDARLPRLKAQGLGRDLQQKWTIMQDWGTQQTTAWVGCYRTSIEGRETENIPVGKIPSVWLLQKLHTCIHNTQDKFPFHGTDMATRQSNRGGSWGSFQIKSSGRFLSTSLLVPES